LTTKTARREDTSVLWLREKKHDEQYEMDEKNTCGIFSTLNDSVHVKANREAFCRIK